MNCRHAGGLVVTGGGTGNRELAEHLSTCGQCRHLAEITLGLEQLGTRQRQADLPQSAILDTQLQAAAILVRNRKQPIVPAVFFLRLLSRPVLTTLAAASVMIAVVVFAWTRATPTPSRTGRTETRTERDIDAVDVQIALLAGRVDANLKGFMDKYRDKECACNVEALSVMLRNDIAACSMDVRRETR